MALSGKEPSSRLKSSAVQRERERAQHAPASLGLEFSGDGVNDEEYKRWRLRNQGVAVPPVEVGTPEECRRQPQQPHWQNRAAVTVAPDQQRRSELRGKTKDDVPPYPTQGFGVDNSIRPGAIGFTTARLQAKSVRSHEHDRRLVVTKSPSGLTPSELATIVPMGFISRGQEFNAMDPNANTQSPELSMDLTGVFALINRSGGRIQAGTLLAAVLPRRIVATTDEKKAYMEGKGGVIPGPAVKDLENIKDEFGLELAPIPTNIFHRLNEVLYTSQVRAWRLGFVNTPYTKANYNPRAALALLRNVVNAELDGGRANTLLFSEGVDVQLTYRMLSAAIGLMDAGFARDVGAALAPASASSAAAGAGAGAGDVKGAGGGSPEWAAEVETLIGAAAGRNITLAEFLNFQKPSDEMDGALKLLDRFQASIPERTEFSDLAVRTSLRVAAGGLDAALALWNASSNQMYQQCMASVFCQAITPANHGAPIEVSKF